MAEEHQKKISKVRSKTRRVHRHDSIKNPALWQTGTLSKKERMEQFSKYRRRKYHASTSATTSAKTTSTEPTTSKTSKSVKKSDNRNETK